MAAVPQSAPLVADVEYSQSQENPAMVIRQSLDSQAHPPGGRLSPAQGQAHAHAEKQSAHN